jgi:hypothetical protein
MQKQVEIKTIGAPGELLMTLKGSAHAKFGLIERDANGQWSSPYILFREHGVRRRNLAEWSEVGAVAAKRFVRLTGREAHKKSLENVRDSIRERFAHDAGRMGRLHALTRKIEEIDIAIAEERAAIAEAENRCRMRCEQRLCALQTEMQAYWTGVLKAHPARDALPPRVFVSADTGEGQYRRKP